MSFDLVAVHLSQAQKAWQDPADDTRLCGEVNTSEERTNLSRELYRLEELPRTV